MANGAISNQPFVQHDRTITSGDKSMTVHVETAEQDQAINRLTGGDNSIGQDDLQKLNAHQGASLQDKINQSMGENHTTTLTTNMFSFVKDSGSSNANKEFTALQSRNQGIAVQLSSAAKANDPKMCPSPETYQAACDQIMNSNLPADDKKALLSQLLKAGARGDNGQSNSLEQAGPRSQDPAVQTVYATIIKARNSL